MSSENRYNLISSFPICMLLISFSCLIALVMAYSILKKSGESRNLCFVPSMRRKAFNISLLRIMLTVDL